MAKLKKSLERYTRAGLLLDELCKAKGWSFRRLAQESGTPQTSIARTALGGRIPSPDKIDKWCQALECTKTKRTELFHVLGLATPEEKEING